MADAVKGRELLAQARLAGLNVQVNGEQLSVRGSRNCEILIRCLIEHKADVLAALSPVGHAAAFSSTEASSSPPTDGWDGNRAIEIQAAVNARLDAAVATIPANHPHRQARLNVLANERGIVAGLLAKRDPILWGWLDSLKQLLERWSEKDRGCPPGNHPVSAANRMRSQT